MLSFVTMVIVVHNSIGLDMYVQGGVSKSHFEKLKGQLEAYSPAITNVNPRFKVSCLEGWS